MRITFVSVPAYGHLYPFMPLALACREAGHEVIVAVGPPFLGRLPLPTVQALPFELTPAVTTPPGEPDRSDPLWSPKALFGTVIGVPMRAALQALWRADPPDLVVYETSAVGAAMAARDLGIAVLAFATSGIGAALGEALGLPTPTILNPMPPSFRAPGTAPVPPHLNIRTTSWSESTTPLPAWLDGPRKRPVAYLTLGTLFGVSQVIRDAAAQLVGAGLDVLVATGPNADPAELSGLHDGVHVEAFLPGHEVFGRVDLVVHHGGMGTLLGALAAGVPQVVVPQGADQFHNAARIAATGCGRTVVLPPQPGVPNGGGTDAPSTDPDIASAAQAILSGATADEVRQMAAEIAALPSPTQIASRIKQLVA